MLALAASGCAATAPAPIVYGGGGAQTSAPSEPAPGRPPPSAQEASAPDWAAAAGTPLSSFALRPEEAQPYDPTQLPRTHRVGEGESLYDIASTYQVPLRALIDQNHLEAPYALSPGRVLELPSPRIHRVARGESLRDIALTYDIDPRSLALLNRLPSNYEARQGDRIVLPAMARARDPAPMAMSTPAAERVTLAPAGRFVWPVRGEIVARFGVQSDGARLDGIEIAAREGAPVSAAADGQVVYTGGDLPAYGTLVLVRHAEGFVTAYGYTRRALVREGQQVRAGQAIAELGGRPDGRARLLFQVRRGREAVDPAPLLGTAN